MMQHVLERRFDRDPIIFLDVRVQAGTNDVDLHRAARNGRLLPGDDNFCGTHLVYNTAVPICELRNRLETVC